MIHFSFRLTMLVTKSISVAVCGVQAICSPHVGMVTCPECLEIIKAHGYK
jgi:hypothetical protein